MNIKKVAGWTAVAFMMWFVITQPSGAAGMIQNMGDIMQNAAEGMSTFMTSIF